MATLVKWGFQWVVVLQGVGGVRWAEQRCRAGWGGGGLSPSVPFPDADSPRSETAALSFRFRNVFPYSEP